MIVKISAIIFLNILGFVRLFSTYYLDEISTLKQRKIENCAASKFIHNQKDKNTS